MEEFRFDLFNEQKYDKAYEERNRAEAISAVLYPNDDTDAVSYTHLDVYKRQVVVYGDLFFDSEYWECFSRFLDILRCRGRVRLSGFHKEIETEGPAFSMVGRFFANGGILEKVRK